MIRQPFDAELVFDLYNSRSDLELLFHHFAPIVWIVLLSEYRGIPEDYGDEMISVAMTTLYDAIRLRKYDQYPQEGLNQFVLWHYAAVRRSMQTEAMDERNWNERRLTKYGIQPASMPKPWHREIGIFLEQLPRELENLVMERVRFEGNGYLACQYVLRCLLNGNRIVDGVIKHELKLPNVKFFVDYVLVSLRLVLYSLRGGVPIGAIREYDYSERELTELC